VPLRKEQGGSGKEIFHWGKGGLSPVSGKVEGKIRVSVGNTSRVECRSWRKIYLIMEVDKNAKIKGETDAQCGKRGGESRPLVQRNCKGRVKGKKCEPSM